MVTALITGPNRVPNVPGDALGRSGVYSPHDPDAAQRLIEAYRSAPQPVIYYPPELATDRREGKLFSVAEKMPDPREVEMAHALVEHETVAENLPGVQLELVPELALVAAAEARPIEALAA